MQRPMFKDFNSEEEANDAVKKMKQKYDSSRIKVVAPFPHNNQTKTHNDYGLPKENVKYDGDMYSLEQLLEGCGFSNNQAKELNNTVESGQVLVIVCQDTSSTFP